MLARLARADGPARGYRAHQDAALIERFIDPTTPERGDHVTAARVQAVVATNERWPAGRPSTVSRARVAVARQQLADR